MKRVLRISDFNQFLANLVSKYRIRNEDGSYPQITSHALRHISIGERSRSNAYFFEDIAKEANHTNLDTTLSYTVSSKNDEAKRLGHLTANILSQEYGATFDRISQPRAVNPIKFHRLYDETPFVRLVGDHKICGNKSCKPQFHDCIECDHFAADPFYLQYFLSMKEMILQRIEKLKKAHSSPEAIEFELHELEIANKYISKIMHRAVDDTDYEPQIIDVINTTERMKEDASGQ